MECTIVELVRTEIKNFTGHLYIPDLWKCNFGGLISATDRPVLGGAGMTKVLQNLIGLPYH